MSRLLYRNRYETAIEILSRRVHMQTVEEIQPIFDVHLVLALALNCQDLLLQAVQSEE